MLPKNHRLQKTKDIQEVLSRGVVIKTPVLRFIRQKTGHDLTRVGFIVSNKVSKRAVRRNRLKRQMREIVRTHLILIEPGYDMIIQAYPSLATKDFREIHDVILDAFRRGQVLIHSDEHLHKTIPLSPPKS